MSAPGYGTFGNLGRDYQKARQEFPAAVFDLFADRLHMAPQSARVLDLGCGTGIATRQLAERRYAMTGSDSDEEMISLAKEEGGSIDYYIARTDKLPFTDAAFDAATAFSAFHWFSDDASVGEIRRVLKPGSLFMIVNKNDVAGFKIGYREVLAQFISGDMPNAKKDYAPDTVLTRSGFTDIERRSFAVDEVYTQDEALAYLRSVSLWNLVEESRKSEAEDAIRYYCESEASDGKLIRSIEVVAVSGRRG